jgi:dihydrofolate synthase / folylpolyglutamate synthase
MAGMNYMNQTHYSSASYTSVLDRITALGADKMTLGVERIRQALETVGNPQNDFKKIHVVGTNGKGSTSRILSTVYQAAGYNVGLFTSPDLRDVRERIQMNHQLIPAEMFCRLGERVLGCIEANIIPLSYFECLTVIGFLAFSEVKVDIAVIEAGLGGRLDSTNVFDTPESYPEAVVITPISVDHVALLGPTLADIAREKVAVLQPNGLAIIASQNEENPTVRDVIQHRARAQASPLTWVDSSGWRAGRLNLETGYRAVITPAWVATRPLTCKLLGPYQVQNMATAVACIDALQDVLPVQPEALVSGLQDTQWPGRAQWLPEKRLLLDGSHNPEGLKTLADMIQADFSEQPLNLALSLLTTKPLEGLGSLLSAHPWQRITLLEMSAETSESPPRRHLPFHPASVLSETLVANGVPANTIVVSPLSEWLTSLSADKTMPLTIATGSLYTAGEILRQLTVNQAS